jgi:hypothetical protein
MAEVPRRRVAAGLPLAYFHEKILQFFRQRDYPGCCSPKHHKFLKGWPQDYNEEFSITSRRSASKYVPFDGIFTILKK